MARQWSYGGEPNINCHHLDDFTSGQLQASDQQQFVGMALTSIFSILFQFFLPVFLLKFNIIQEYF